MFTRHLPKLMVPLMLTCPTWASNNAAEEPIINDTKPFQAIFTVKTPHLMGVEITKISIHNFRNMRFVLDGGKWEYTEEIQRKWPLTFVYGETILVVLNFLRKVDCNFADRDHGLMIGEDSGPHQFDWKHQEGVKGFEVELSPMAELRKELGEPGLNPTNVILRIEKAPNADLDDPKAQIFKCTLEAKLNRFADDLMADDN